jgi:hypothetical protein
MAVSDISVCNIALSRVGVDAITALTDSSKQARLCKLNFQDCLDAVIEAADWVCARAQKSITADVTAPDHTWDYRYLLPTSPYCLRLLTVKDTDGNNVEYQLFGRYIFTNEDEGLNVTYAKRISVFQEMSAELVQTVALRLARMLLPSLTWTAARQASLDKDYEASILQAKINGAAQDYVLDAKENDGTNGNAEWLLAGRT